MHNVSVLFPYYHMGFANFPCAFMGENDGKPVKIGTVHDLTLLHLFSTLLKSSTYTFPRFFFLISCNSKSSVLVMFTSPSSCCASQWLQILYCLVTGTITEVCHLDGRRLACGYIALLRRSFPRETANFFSGSGRLPSL